MIRVNHRTLSPTALTKHQVSASKVLDSLSAAQTWVLWRHQPSISFWTQYYTRDCLWVGTSPQKSAFWSPHPLRGLEDLCPRRRPFYWDTGAWGRVMVGIAYPEEIKNGFFFVGKIIGNHISKWAHFRARAITSPELVNWRCCLLKVGTMLLNKFKDGDLHGGGAELLLIRLLI